MAYCENGRKQETQQQAHECGNLIEDGYYVCCVDSGIADDDYKSQQAIMKYDKDNHHLIGNHRKPYIIIHFDNPNHGQHSLEDLGRKLAPLSKVFLYVSMNLSIGNIAVRGTLPWLILRDILAYRNRIMHFLSEDFNGDIMSKHAISTQQDNILTHERAASHATTTDDCSILQVFGLEDVYVSKLSELLYPIVISNKKLIDKEAKPEERCRPIDSYKNSELWLLLQSYVNGQIARLFNRSFNDNEELENEAGIPALYVSEDNENTESVFKKRLTCFDELGLATDNRFLLIQKAVEIIPHESLSGAEMYHSIKQVNDKCKLQPEKFFNIEYMRCILLDIILTSIKYATTNDSLLPRVNRLMRWKVRKRSPASVCCRVLLFRSGEDLVVLNNVKPNMMDRRGIEAVNEEIYRRTHDPLDYGDGHMSLFTIRKFILGIRQINVTIPPIVDTSFCYVLKDEVLQNPEYIKAGIVKDYGSMISEDENWFQTRLPIFKGGNSNV